MTIRIAYSLFTQRPGRRRGRLPRKMDRTCSRRAGRRLRPPQLARARCWSSPPADFEGFLRSRAGPRAGHGGLRLGGRVVRVTVEHRWPVACTPYNESISRMLDVFEKVNRDIPFNGLHWFFDHAETVTRGANIRSRIKALGGGVPCSTAWPSRGILCRALRHQKPARHHAAGGEMLEPALPVGLGRMPPAWRATTRGPRSTGWSPARNCRRDADVRPQRPSGPRYPPDAALDGAAAWFSSEQNPEGQIERSASSPIWRC